MKAKVKFDCDKKTTFNYMLFTSVSKYVRAYFGKGKEAHIYTLQSAEQTYNPTHLIIIIMS